MQRKKSQTSYRQTGTFADAFKGAVTLEKSSVEKFDRENSKNPLYSDLCKNQNTSLGIKFDDNAIIAAYKKKIRLIFADKKVKKSKKNYIRHNSYFSNNVQYPIPYAYIRHSVRNGSSVILENFFRVQSQFK